MAGDELELARRMSDAFDRDDLEGILELADSEVEFISLAFDLEGTVYRGHEGVRDWYRDLRATLRGLEVERGSYRELGDGWVLHTARSRARGDQSGATVDWPVAQLSLWRDGRVVYMRLYTSEADALADRRLSRPAADPRR